MTLEKFKELWNVHALNWYDNCKISTNEVIINAKDVCKLRGDEYVPFIHQRYELIKDKVKELYFTNAASKDTTINPFKRAAIIVYAVNSLDPIVFSSHLNIPVKNINSLFLKQRLAFHLGLHSILMEFPEDLLKNLSLEIPHFDFEIVSIGVGGMTGDSFLKGIYKDIFFSEIYKNYNVITMSNVYLLIIERSSQFRGVFSKLLEQRDTSHNAKTM